MPRKIATAEEWTGHKEELRRLYVVEDRTLQEIEVVMRKKYGFGATLKQYERRFNRWGFRKNLKAAEWQAVCSKIRKRKSEGKKSEVTVDGVPFSEEKIRRGVGRYNSSVAQVCRTPEGVVVRTPVPCTLDGETHSESILVREMSPLTLGATSSRPEYFQHISTIEMTSFEAVSHQVYTQDYLCPNEPPNPLHDQSISAQRQEAGPLLNDYLICAAVDGCLTRAERLLSWGANVDYASTDHYVALLLHKAVSPLACAALRNRLEIVQLLLEKGANVEGPCCGAKEVLTPLHAAVLARDVSHGTHQSLPVIRALLEAGANINRIASGLKTLPKTALQIAVEANDRELVKYLLASGADVNAAAMEHGITPFQAAFRVEAAQAGEEEMWRFLWRYSGDIFDPPVKHGSVPALVASIRARNIESTRFLVDNGADIDFTGAETQAGPALSEAILINDMRLVDLLLEKGAAVNSPKAVEYGCTALQAAAYRGNLDLTKRLLRLKACPQDAVALFLAVDGENWNIADVLISAADQHMASEREPGYGRMGLTTAIKRRNWPIIKRLVSIGTSLGPDDPILYEPLRREECSLCRLESSNPFSYEWETRPGTFWYLVNGTANYKRQSPLAAAVEVNDMEIVGFLLCNKADAREIDQSWNYDARPL